MLQIRHTHVQDGEAGGITQQIGATMVPEEAIREQTKMIKDVSSTANYLFWLKNSVLIFILSISDPWETNMTWIGIQRVYFKDKMVYFGFILNAASPTVHRIWTAGTC